MSKLSYNKKRKVMIWVGISILLLCTFAFLTLFTGLIKPVKYFFLGTFGLFSYPLFIVLFVVGLAIINKKKYIVPTRYIIYITLAVVALLAIVQNIIVGSYAGSFGEFLVYNYTKQLTPGGIIISLLMAPIKYTLGVAGVYAIFSILFIVFVCLIVDYLVYVRKNAERNAPIKIQRQKEELKEQKKLEKIEKKVLKGNEKSSEWLIDKEGNLIGKDGKVFSVEKPETVGELGTQDDDTHLSTLSKIDMAIVRRKSNEEKPKITLNGKIEEEKSHESSNESARQKLGLIKNGTVIASSEPIKEPNLREKFEKNEVSRKEYLLTPPKLNEMGIFNHVNDYTSAGNKVAEGASSFYTDINNNLKSLKEEQHSLNNDISYVPRNNLETVNTNDSSFDEYKKEETEGDSSFVDLDDDSFNTPESKAVAGDIIEKIMNDEKEINISAENLKPQAQRATGIIKNQQIEIAGAEKKSPIETPKNFYKKPQKYNAPNCDLLFDVKNDNSELQEKVQQQAIVLENALETFNINAKVIRIVVGPSVTRYELEMPVGVPVKKILAHQDDIALNLASNGDIRIEAPIPGRSAVGIEVPNDKISTVGIKEILSSKEFQEAKNPLSFALGKDIGGSIRVCNLAKMPHLLVAGSTGSGKSVCLNSIIISMLFKSSPDDLKLILIDPKRVEFSMYNGLPHLMLPNVITETDKAINALGWSVNEMERRFGLFQETKARNLEEYNMCQEVLTGERPKLPLIVIIIDELADLMTLVKKDIEEKIMRLAQKARAAGIHLILATQRPSVNVITGTIKANFPSRIAFAVTSFVDSKTILDMGGAEKLLGKGDMLYAPSDQAEPTRIQGCYIDGKEVENVVEYIKNNNHYDFDMDKANDVVVAPKGYGGNPFAPNPEAQSDELMPLALRLFIENGQASITMLQRRFRIGFARAANIVDEMELKGYVGPAEGSKQRPVLMTMEEYNKLFGEAE